LSSSANVRGLGDLHEHVAYTSNTSRGPGRWLPSGSGILQRVKIGRRHAALFLGIAAWNVVTYVTFIRNLAGTEGRSTGYYVAHTILIVVNLLIAAVLAWLGLRTWRATRVPSDR
jgi:hypothetical protein